MIDITELTAEDRQRALRLMPTIELHSLLEKLMRDNRKDEIGARLDALTAYAIRLGADVTVAALTLARGGL